MSYAEAQYAVDETLSRLRKNPTAGLVPNNVANLIIAPGDRQVQITFTPSDIMIDGKLLCTMAGVIIRRKVGSAPINENDGDLIADLSGDSLYAYTSSPLVDSGLTNGQSYYYRFFSYSDNGMVNRSDDYTRLVIPNKKAVWGFHQDFTNLDPDSSISYIEDSAGYTPMMTNSGSGTPTEGSWANWAWLKENLPYMVNKDGVVDYQLDPNDYSKKVDGSYSDVANSSYQGGAFAWLPKIYMKEVYASDGNSRDVYFALDNESSNTSDFHLAPGFFDKLGNELDGLWIPMFYVASSATNQSYSGATPVLSRSTEEQLTILDNFSSKAALLGGPIMNTLRDLYYLLYKSTNIQEKGGYGNCSNSTQLANSIVSGGRFYGNTTRRSLNKAFHSAVLFSYNLALADPYTVRSSDYNLYFNTLYNAFGTNVNSGIKYQSSSYQYPSKLGYGGDTIGSIPISENTASSVTGLCDAVIALSSASSRISTRLGNYQNDVVAGPAHIECQSSIANGNVRTGFGTIILPPVGYTPAV